MSSALYLGILLLALVGPTVALEDNVRDDTQELEIAATNFNEVGDQDISDAELKLVGPAELRHPHTRHHCRSIGGIPSCRRTCPFDIAFNIAGSRKICCLPPIRCEFDGKNYGIGYILKEACVELICESDGQWKFTGKYINDCGGCIVAGEPWVQTFDNVIDSYLTKWYRTIVGKSHKTYVLTESDLTNTPNFRVTGNFFYATNWESTPGTIGHGNGSYVDCITYFEDKDKGKERIVIKWTCEPGGNGNLMEPCGTGYNLKHSSDSVSWTPILSLPAHVGEIWIFEDPAFGKGDCIIIVGTKGLTVKVCPRELIPVNDIQYKLPFVYIYASRSLLPTSNTTSKFPSKLYGLCNTFTGKIAQGYIPKTGSPLYSNCFDTGTGLAKYIIDNTHCSPFVDSWKCNHAHFPHCG